MISAAIFGAVLGQEILHFGKFSTRAEFAKAMPPVMGNFGPIMGNYSRAQVEARLGKPDDIWKSTDSTRYVWMPGCEIWCYGTNGHHTFPTVGSVLFFRDDAVFMRGGRLFGEESGITEVELRKALRTLDRMEYMDLLPGQTTVNCSDPLRLIQVTNELLPLGTEKALAAIETYSYIRPGASDDFLFWLVRTLFVGKAPNYVFSEPARGLMDPKPPKDLAIWPLFPMFIEQDLPINAVRFSGMQGGAYHFNPYFRAHKGEWQIRPKPFVPPNDPFPIYLKLAKQNPWVLRDPDKERFNAESENKLQREFPGLSVVANKEPFQALQRSILFAVRNVLKLDLANIKPANFEQIHRQFLALGGHWDAVHICYARKDGAFDKDAPEVHHNIYYEFPKIGPISVTIKSMTSNDQFGGHNLDVSAFEEGKGLVSTAVVRIADSQSGKILDFVSPNTTQENLSHDVKEATLLKQPKHKAGTRGGGVNMQANIKPGRPVTFIVVYEGKVVKSPSFLID